VAGRLDTSGAGLRALEKQLLETWIHGIVGKSPAMLTFSTSRGRWRGTTQRIWWWDRRARKRARGAGDSSNQPVSSQRLAVCNCSAMWIRSLESQLFGTRAARSPARPTPSWVIRVRNAAPLFLDEAARPSGLQANFCG